ncbi:hypothetical protein D1007_12270 [Hordeum vulgare]|nr:hypothetical protein D1007_12270 [Hordeum vulgare]
MAGREGGNRFNPGDGGGEGRFGRGGGRFGHGGGRDRGGGGGCRNMVWMRDNDDGGSSNVDPRHGSSHKARWDTMAMEQGGREKPDERESEKGPTEGTSYEKIVMNSLQIIPSPVINRKFSSYLDACVGEPTVTEMEHDDKSCLKEDQVYFVQSPFESSEPVDVIPTSPAWRKYMPGSAKGLMGSTWSM